MRDIIIFCGAPADIQYALSIYEENLIEGEFHFFAVNVENMYKYLTSLRLKNARIEFIPYPNDSNSKNPFSVIKWKRYLNNVISRHFNDIENSEIYYFGKNFDWLTFACIAKLVKSNKVYNYDPYSGGEQSKKSTRLLPMELLRLLVYFYLTGIIFEFEEVNNKKNFYFNPNKFGIIKRDIYVPEVVYRKYSYQIENNVKNRKILFIESDISSYKMISEYEETLLKVIFCMKQRGISIYIKPHPRLGYSKFLDELDLQILPDYIPGEFISNDNFSAIMGIETVAIAKIARIWDGPVYSILDLFTFYDTLNKDRYRKYLSGQSENKVIFLDSMDAVKSI